MTTRNFIENRRSLSLGEHVRSVDWSPDGLRVVAGLADGRLGFIDVMAGSIVREVLAHPLGVQQVVWSPCGGRVASGGEDGFVRCWDVLDGRRLFEAEAGGYWTEHVAWSPDGGLLATGSGKHLRVWDREGRMAYEWTGHSSVISGLQWRADGKALGTSSYGAVQLFRLGESLPYEPLVMKSAFLCIAWSSNSRHVAAGTQENSVTYWRLPSRGREPLQMTGYACKVKSLAWDRSGRYLATDGGDEVCVWDVSGPGPAGRKPLQLRSHRSRISRLAFQKHGDLLASGCAGGEVWIWDPFRSSGGAKVAQLTAEISQLGWAPGEKRLIIASADGAVRWIE